MPLPQPSHAHTMASGLSTGGVLFVSYAHEDLLEFAAPFIDYLILKLRGLPELGYGEADIFFDRNRLKAGQFWDEAIQTALERADALIFLLSPHALLSQYCMERELATAAQRGIRIIPVLLQACPWASLPLPGDPRKRRLGDIGALPKAEDFSLRPVSDWATPEAAWDATVDQLVEALQGAAAPGVTSVPARPSCPPCPPPLLPYFCDQQPIEAAFNRGMLEWSAAALLVLVKGLIDDRPLRFWDRLRQKNLADFTTARRQLPLLEQRALNWPSAWDGARVRKTMTVDVLCALSDALTGNTFAIASPEALATRLDALHGVLPLMTTLPDEPPRALAAGLQALCGIFAACPGHAPLDRLVIAFVIEDGALIAADNLLKRFKLAGHARVRVVELEPLQALTRDEVRIWHRSQQVEKFCDLDEPSLLTAVFDDAESLRFGLFESRLKPLLGL